MLTVASQLLENVPMFEFGIVLLAFAVSLFYIFIFGQDTKNQSSKFFLIFSCAVFVWGVTFIFFDASLQTPFIHRTVAFTYFIAGFIAPTLFFALDTFSNRGASRPFWKIALIFGPYLALSIGFLFPGVIVGYEPSLSGGEGKISFGKLFPVYVLYSVSLVGVGLFFLTRKYRESAGIFKLEIRDFLVSFSVTAFVTLTGTLFLPIFTGTQEYFWFGYVGGALLFLILTGLIIIKYNFWSLKLIATEFFISVVLLTLLAELFFAKSVFDLLIKVAITFIVVFISFFLVGSVRREIQSKDKIENLLRTLDDMHARLKVLDKKKSEFLSIASHHLRDPLTAIKGYSSMLMEGSFGVLSEQVRQAIEKIFDSSNHLITMISDFMDISRIESGDMKYVFDDVDVRKMVLDLGVEMNQYADRARLLLDVTIDEGLAGDGVPFMTVGDAGKLRQVFSNLIDNSIKYTPHGEVSVLLSKSPDGKKILFSVSDTGIGMNDLTKEKIFRKFSRAEGVSKVYTEGTGLGLYVAKEIVKKHEGRIWAESKGEGHGSTFYVELDAKR